MSAIQPLLTDHIDIWTAAETEKKSGRGRASGNAGSVYGIKKLRELILELAVRGKLVPQDASDEPASELLKRIQAEKAKLIAEGKIKKEKPLAAITEDEKLFVLPKGWMWTRLGEVCSYIQRGKSPAYVDQSDFIVVSQKCVRWSGLDLSQARFIDPDSLNKYEAVRKLCGGDILWNSTGTGTIGRACFVPPLDIKQILVVDSHVTIVRPIVFESVFLWRWIQSPSVQTKIEGVASGTTNQIELNTSTVVLHPFPLPPLGEQRRIVAKVDELMALCDQLESQHSNATEAHEKLVSHLLGTLLIPSQPPLLQRGGGEAGGDSEWQHIAAHFDTLFTTDASIDALKQTLLQLAVMGKLVPQNANDEPASELLKRIQVEKAKLIAEGKIKKDKPLPLITDEEKPFELPCRWEWVRLFEVTTGMDSGWSPACLDNCSPSDNVWGVLKTTAVQVMEYFEYENKELPENLQPRPEAETKAGDILFTRAGPINRVAISCFVRVTRPKLMISDKIIRFHPVDIGVDGRFMTLCLNAGATADYLENAKSGMAASQVNISQEKLRLAPIPMPPLAEQHRIVAKVDELMTLCDQLKSRITDASRLQQKLADVLVEQAVA